MTSSATTTKTTHICPICEREGTDKDFSKDAWGRQTLCNTCKKHM